ncbi:hypothetical protein HNQ10_001681 [Deinococcus metallilatus]|uniref:Uncharacterized protein n=1 Tax=Deinococcus metallilatus TaxID=1211322 RepID=A0ABR6MSF6_9DEIO|nr:hypothetical protein [Deinococcus metallilatus]GMA16787.1 hypothetical protein GCM10025871_31180 [Deinococcus metallilatus]
MFLAFTWMMLHRAPDLSFEEAAGLALTLSFPFLRLNVIFDRLAEDEEFLRHHGYSPRIARL